MSEARIRPARDLDLEKLGIRQIHERIEVTAILADPGGMGANAADGTPKSYVCTITFPGGPVPPPNLS